MLRNVTAVELESCIAAFWSVAQELTRSGYPTYADGIKTFADFSAYVRMAFQEPWGKVLMFEADGQADGFVVLEEVDEAYLSLPVCLARENQRQMLAELLAFLESAYPGRTLWLGFAPENVERLEFARMNGFSLLDESVNWQRRLNGWACIPADAAVHGVTAQNDEAFRGLWTDRAMYWNADRIAAHRDEWTLFLYEDDAGPLAAAACMKDRKMPEIFGFMYRETYDPVAHRALLAACLNAACDAGAQYLIYFAGAQEHAIMAELGFEKVSGYVCYEKQLPC